MKFSIKDFFNECDQIRRKLFRWKSRRGGVRTEKGRNWASKKQEDTCCTSDINLKLANTGHFLQSVSCWT